MRVIMSVAVAGLMMAPIAAQAQTAHAGPLLGVTRGSSQMPASDGRLQRRPIRVSSVPIARIISESDADFQRSEKAQDREMVICNKCD